MTPVDAATAAAVWVAVGLVAYAAVSYALLFYLPPAESLPSGTVADAAFALTLPFVLAVTWLSTVGNRP